MTDPITETTSTSWFTRIKNAFTGIITGFVLVIGACTALFWNEGRAVDRATSLEQGLGLVQTIDPSQSQAGMNGKLIHFSGDLIVEEILQDANFDKITSPKGATRLVRTVKMLQWVQNTSSTKKKKLGGGEETVTTYSYDKQWVDSAVDSSKFKQPTGHENPPMQMENGSKTIDHAKVGRVKISGAQLAGLGKTNDLVISGEMVEQVSQRFGETKNILLQEGKILVAQNSNSPTIGDIRIGFSYSSSEKITAIGRFTESELARFETENGGTIFMIRDGIVDAQQMFADAKDSAGTMTWIIRVAGFMAMLAGFNMIFALVGVLGDVVPFIGDVFRFATGLAAMALTAILASLTIGVAWIYYRPIVGITILLVGLVCAIVAIVVGKRKAGSQKLNDSQMETA